jgi:hypothetical protein
MSKAKFSQSGIEREVILNPHAARLYCQWHKITIAELYDSVAERPGIVQAVERLASGIKALKPSVIGA